MKTQKISKETENTGKGLNEAYDQLKGPASEYLTTSNPFASEMIKAVQSAGIKEQSAER